MGCVCLPDLTWVRMIMETNICDRFPTPHEQSPLPQLLQELRLPTEGDLQLPETHFSSSTLDRTSCNRRSGDVMMARSSILSLLLHLLGEVGLLRISVLVALRASAVSSQALHVIFLAQAISLSLMMSNTSTRNSMARNIMCFCDYLAA